MIDRAIGLFGLALALVIGLLAFVPEGWPKIPLWLTLTGIGVGIFLCGLGVGLVMSGWRGGSHPRPNLRLSLLGGNIFTPDAKDVRNRLTGIVLDISVWNTGAPSVATEWSLFVVAQNAAPVPAQVTEIPEALRLGGLINSAVIRSSESLQDKTKVTPISNAPVQGKLLFYVTMKLEIVRAASTRLELTVKDMYGTESRVTKLGLP
jgi:hypothetical protein